MEIPYTAQPREETGLYNAKVGIWLFLASEVMLFGALFSAYILLRVGAAPGTWPHGLLNVPLGMINTLVLICSSVTVVMSWASLKMNQFNRYAFYQTITVLCALTFMGIKAVEYTDKFTHYEVHLKDGSVVDGHLVEKTTNSITIHMLKPHRMPGAAGHQQPHGAPAAAEHGGSQPAGADASAHGHQERKIDFSEIAVRPSGKLHMEAYGPWHNAYMAIYFTLTGLHAMHVLGGALVISYILWPGRKMWRTDPERYTNRVEVSGLFWHFVDLVWIFLFPVLYLL